MSERMTPDPTGEHTPAWILRLPFPLRMPALLVASLLAWLARAVRVIGGGF